MRTRRLFRKAKNKTLLAAAAAVILLTAAIRLGLLNHADHALSDLLYQSPCARSGKIVLVQIDQKAVEELGPYDRWGRGVIADVIDRLNRSEECRPAVIGLDILYAGESDPQEDERLAEASGRYGNVVAASDAVFGTDLVPDGAGDYRLRQNAMLNYEEPYQKLADVVTIGHVNCMLDTDGILRHHMLSLTLPDGRTVPSFALAIASMYQEAAGGAPVKLPATNSRGFWYIPFSAAPEKYSEWISVADVLNGKADAEYFNGKIVLIGPYAPGFQDSYTTSIDHAAAMYGVEIQANVIEALLRGEYPREVSDRLQLAVFFAVCMLLLLAFRGRRVRTATAVLVVAAGAWLAVCRLAYGAGYLLHVLWVPAAAALLYVGCMAANYIRSAMETRQVKNTFSRYVAPEIVQEILKEGTDSLKLGGKLTDIAVLFVDVRGFTPMSEALDPETVVAILNRYLTLIAECIRKNRGTLDKFVGDAAMAFWGAPLPQEDYVMMAARAAMDMAEGSKDLSEELLQKYGRTVSFGIGVHAGEAVIGNIGAPERMDYTAIGDTVNTAARLEANAPGGTVYISREVADRLAGRIRTRSLGDTVRLKGKAEGFEVLILEEITG